MKYNNEQQVLNALGIESFRNITKDKIMEFVSLIPSMDREVAIAAVNQFPAYKEFAGDMVSQLKDMCQDALNANSKSQDAAIEAYMKILDSQQKLLENPNLTSDEKDTITRNMMLVADKIAAKDTENKDFILKIFRIGAIVTGGALLLGAALLGVKLTKGSIPQLKK